MPRATVEAVEDYELAGSIVTLECVVEVDDGAPTPGDTVTLPHRVDVIQIEFLAPDVFRFVFDAVPEAGGNTAGLDLDEAAISAPVDLTISETDQVLVIESTALTIRIGLAEWSFSVRDQRGDCLLEEQRNDHTAKGESRVGGLGYSAEPTNRWPYTLTDAGTSFVLGGDEHVYGFGEQFTEFDVRGRTVESWVTQPNGAETGHAYKNVPFFLSTQGYGLLVDTTAKTVFDVGDSSVVSHQIHVDDDTFAFVFFGKSDFTEILDQYTALTGRPPRVPRWSYGVWMSRASYDSQSEVETVADRLREEAVPCDVIHLDPAWLDGLCSFTWDRSAFPNPSDLIEKLHDDGFRVSLWEYPYLLSETDAFEHAREAGYLVEDGTGSAYILDRLSWSSDRGGIVDFTNPEARSWWAAQHRPLLEQGVDVFKVDFGEYLPEDAVLDNGHSGRAVRNEYPNLYAATVWDAIEDFGATDRPVLWTRSGWAGGQRYPVHWGGDPAATFESMAASFRGGLSLGLSGYAYWSVDVGGFHGTPSTPLYVRWAQASLLGTSHVRFHGTTPREPWAFGDEALEIVRRYAEERYRLVPYFETLGEIAHQTGTPVMRPLVLEFQDDHGAQTCGDQLMVGPAILTAPVFNQAGKRSVYLPPGEWVEYWSHDRVMGGQTVHRDCALDEIPVYLQAGTMHPRATEARVSLSDSPPDSLELRGVLADGHATGTALDPSTQELVDVAITSEGDSLACELGFEVDVTINILAVESPPKHVVVDDDNLEQVAASPATGEWTHDEDSEILHINPV